MNNLTKYRGILIGVIIITIGGGGFLYYLFSAFTAPIAPTAHISGIIGVGATISTGALVGITLFTQGTSLIIGIKNWRKIKN